MTKNITAVGIDPDTKRLTLVVTRKHDQKHPEIFRIKLSKDSDHIKSCGLAFRGMSEIITQLIEEDGDKPRLFLEAPVVGGGAQSGFRIGPTIPQTQIGGAVIAAAEEFSCRLVLVNNSSWKKRVCGNGNIAKSEIPGVMETVWPELVKEAVGDQNAIDAGAINLFGRQNLKLRARLKSRGVSVDV